MNPLNIQLYFFKTKCFRTIIFSHRCLLFSYYFACLIIRNDVSIICEHRKWKLEIDWTIWYNFDYRRNIQTKIKLDWKTSIEDIFANLIDNTICEKIQIYLKFPQKASEELDFSCPIKSLRLKAFTNKRLKIILTQAI